MKLAMAGSYMYVLFVVLSKFLSEVAILNHWMHCGNVTKLHLSRRYLHFIIIKFVPCIKNCVVYFSAKKVHIAPVFSTDLP